ncbi:ABC transporter substrate-binding protein [Ideonella sp. A 288]|uniref:ABC transporter substrate-binding protein n=1 Tax=Ideonella sp. A 288 TaxID=1962181 RepID=UPI000B4B079A|nr:ABC transporter substrate-binding protein [Ideonella sp. A 288]
MPLRRRELIGAAGAAAWPAGATAADDGVRTLRLAFNSPESGLDPAQANSSHYSAKLLSQILEAPLSFDYLARPVRLVPATAVALPEVSADGRRFTFRLRPGIYFSDDPAFRGTRRELVAQDFVYSLKRFFDPRWKSSDLYLLEAGKMPGLAALRERALKGQPFDYDTETEGLRAVDRHTFVVQLGESNPRFIYNFATPGLFGAVAREVVEFYGDDIGAHPVGTGAFRLGAWRRGARIELLRSPSHRGTRYEGQPADQPEARAIAAQLAGRTLPLLDRIVVDIVEEAQPRWLAFLNGQHDLLELPSQFAPMAVPGGRLAPFLARRGVRLQRALQPDITMNYFNMEDPLVGGYTAEKVALRRAIALAYDGAREIAQVRGGLALPAQSPVPPFTSGYDPGYRSEMDEHSRPKARALLDLYGYLDRDGDGWRETPDGQPLVLRMATQSDQLSRSLNELWKRALDAVGLRVVFEVSTWPELLKKSRTNSLMIWGYAWSAASPDGGFFLGIAYGPNATESNDSRFALPAFDRLFERQSRLPDGPERDALMRQAKDLLVAYMPYKVHNHRIMVDLLQPRVRHHWRHPFMRDYWQFLDVGDSR